MYHWELFRLIKLGRHDLNRDGPVNGEVRRKVDAKYAFLPPQVLKSRLRFGGQSQNSGSGSGSLYCTKHGRCQHATKDCRMLQHRPQGQGGAGQGQG
jgi:hypothetical protein